MGAASEWRYPTNRRGDRELEWYREYEAWRLAVLVQAGIISVNLENWLETLNEVGPPRADEMGTQANATLWVFA